MWHYAMVAGVVMLLFIGFNRVWHFLYIRLDAMLCGFFGVERLPVVSTFWRYLDSMGINQANSLINIMSILRCRVWSLCGINHQEIAIDIDTTVETVYGNQQGGRKGHNTKHRGKKGYRPVLCFIEQTREYLYGKLRKGETISGVETAKLVRKIKVLLPAGVRKVLIQADGEFKNNYAFFQIVMLAYNIWRYLKILAQKSSQDKESAVCNNKPHGFAQLMDSTIRIARLKLLMIASKVVKDGNRNKVKYSIHDARTPALLGLFKFLDRKRLENKNWEDGLPFFGRFNLQTV